MADLVLYGDFNCPFSALASERVARLEQRGLAAVEWRAVEHDPTIPPQGVPVEGALVDLFTTEFGQIDDLLVGDEAPRTTLPRRQVNTALAVSRYAGTPEPDRAALRQRMFRAHWEGTGDIDRDADLDLMGAGPPAPAVARDWAQTWQAAAGSMVPVLVLADGYVSRGLGALSRLASMLDR